MMALSVAACTDGDETTTVGTRDGDAVAAEPTAAPPAPTSTSAPVAEPTSEPTAVAVAAPASCDDVPSFRSADTVSIACAGAFAVSPELFASTAGWHLFEDTDGAWIEADYAMTCCTADDPSFVELLTRNGLDEATVSELCDASGLADDPFSGCDPDRANRPSAFDIDPTWLRVNGFGVHDFGAVDTDVLTSTEEVFGAALSVGENSECGGGPMTIATFDDFSLNFQSGEFVGWFYSSSDPALSTPSGVGPGITEATLREVYQGVDISESTLGLEFYFEVDAGSMSGFIDPDANSVQSLFAGLNCFFR